jgi:predicted DNA-binding transcriptional regulator AlpA
MTTITGKPDDLLTTAEMAAILGIRINTAEIWRVYGKGPIFLKLGDGLRAPVRYRRSDVVAWLEQRLRASTSAHTAAITAAQRPAAQVVRTTPAPNAPWLRANA